MKKYEKPNLTCLEMSSFEDVSAFSKFDSFDGAYSTLDQNVSSYLWTSGKGYEA